MVVWVKISTLKVIHKKLFNLKQINFDFLSHRTQTSVFWVKVLSLIHSSIHHTSSLHGVCRSLLHNCPIRCFFLVRMGWRKLKGERKEKRELLILLYWISSSKQNNYFNIIIELYSHTYSIFNCICILLCQIERVSIWISCSINAF